MKKPAWMQDLEADGWTVLKTKSYLAAQERQRVAKVRMDDAFERVASTERWAREAFAEERRLRERCTYLYGVAASLGATEEQLRGALLRQDPQDWPPAQSDDSGTPRS